MATTIIEEDWPQKKKYNSKYHPSKVAQYPWKEGALFKEKDKTNKGTNKPIQILDNKENALIYRDSKIEIYVKNEAILDNYVECFNAKDILDYNFNFKYYNVPYYKDDSEYLLYSDEYIGNVYEKIYPEIGLLTVNKDIKTSYYNNQFPYVAELVFKNLWGCDFKNELNNYLRECNILIQFSKNFQKYLRKEESNYNEFFDQGYITEAQLCFGENFEKDEILGSTNLNNYCSIIKKNKFIVSNWDPSIDSTIQENFPNSDVSNPFTNYLIMKFKRGIPFFKQKEFQDSYINLVLEKIDILGNITQRIVKLPVHILFFNNLIKGYWKKIVKDKDTNQDKITYKEHLNSSGIYSFYVTKSQNNQWSHKHYIWCPNVKKLNLSSTTLSTDNKCNFTMLPTLVDLKESNNLNGSLCILKYEFDISNCAVGDKINVINLFEYSDGENYDKFILNINTEVK